MEIKIQSRTNLNGGELERIRGREYQEKYEQRVLEGEVKLEFFFAGGCLG